MNSELNKKSRKLLATAVPFLKSLSEFRELIDKEMECSPVTSFDEAKAHFDGLAALYDALESIDVPLEALPSMDGIGNSLPLFRQTVASLVFCKSDFRRLEEYLEAYRLIFGFHISL